MAVASGTRRKSTGGVTSGWVAKSFGCEKVPFLGVDCLYSLGGLCFCMFIFVVFCLSVGVFHDSFHVSGLSFCPF